MKSPSTPCKTNVQVAKIRTVCESRAWSVGAKNYLRDFRMGVVFRVLKKIGPPLSAVDDLLDCDTADPAGGTGVLV